MVCLSIEVDMDVKKRRKKNPKYISVIRFWNALLCLSAAAWCQTSIRSNQTMFLPPLLLCGLTAHLNIWASCWLCSSSVSSPDCCTSVVHSPAAGIIAPRPRPPLLPSTLPENYPSHMQGERNMAVLCLTSHPHDCYDYAVNDDIHHWELSVSLWQTWEREIITISCHSGKCQWIYLRCLHKSKW